MQAQQLRRWIGWFFLVNIILICAVQLTYVTVMPQLSAIAGSNTYNLTFAYIFLGLSYVAHAAIIGAFCALVMLLCSYVICRKGFIFPLAIILSVTVLIAQIIDRLAYKLYHAHQFALGITLLKSGAINEEMPLSMHEYIFLALIIIALLVLECAIAYYIWRKLNQSTGRKKYGFKVATGLATIIVASYAIMFFVVSAPQQYRFKSATAHLLLKMARLVPYYQNVYSWIIPGGMPATRTWANKATTVNLQNYGVDKPLNYPMHPVQCSAPAKKLNIIFLVFDTLRYDALNARVMPNMQRFSAKTQRFSDVYSGGNCTQPGIFSLFYGIPPTYWNATVSQQRQPMLLDELHKQGYQFGIFASASLLFPQFNKNLFSKVKNLQIDTRGNTSVERDRRVTKLFSKFLNTRNSKKPFFSFVFYDAVHNYCEGGSKQNMSPFTPAIAQCQRFALTTKTDPTPYINRYDNAAHFLDQQASIVLQQLRAHNLMRNTIVVITADHGEQHNDQRLGYWSHASAYTPYQLHVPMLIYWPGMTPKDYNYFATNYDVAPTIMQRALGCNSNPKAYSTGSSLFYPRKIPFFVAGSYTDYAIVTPHQVTRIYPGGDYAIYGPLGHHMASAQLNIPLLKQAMAQMRLYFKS